jgi:NTE family protein
MTQSLPNTSQSASDDLSHNPTGTALVLGGGGALGNAWLIGVLAGLLDAGLDVTDADLIVGTSAGATAAAQVTGASPATLLADILAASIPEQSVPRGSAGGAGNRPTSDALKTTSAIIAAADDVADMRRKIGAWALEVSSRADPGANARWRATVAARLPSQSWPQRDVLLTAVDAATGEPVVFDRHSGVDMADAVAASCASMLPYAIDEHLYIDGGYRTNADNADLAAGYARVLVLSPFGGKSRTPADWGTHLETQIAALRAGGSLVETIFPDDNSTTAFGNNMMDLSRRPAAARAGHEQGRACAEELLGFWR